MDGFAGLNNSFNGLFCFFAAAAATALAVLDLTGRDLKAEALAGSG